MECFTNFLNDKILAFISNRFFIQSKKKMILMLHIKINILALHFLKNIPSNKIVFNFLKNFRIKEFI